MTTDARSAQREGAESRRARLRTARGSRRVCVLCRAIGGRADEYETIVACRETCGGSRVRTRTTLASLARSPARGSKCNDFGASAPTATGAIADRVRSGALCETIASF